ncbi:hypothetical protein P5V15_014648 [Pogonomyrmex californicus]
MGFIDDELQEVSQLCHNVVDGSHLVSCVRSMVRVEITKTSFKQLVVCIQFQENYPASPLFIELKSKTLSAKLLDGLAEVCEKECKRFLNKAQILPILKFVSNFIEENPLVCCYEEISTLKKLLDHKDELKLKQKSSSINLTLRQGLYHFKTKLGVPYNYPTNCVTFSDIDTNFPPLFSRFLVGQGKELARQCVEPPLKSQKQQKLFTPSPSLNTVVSFLIKSVKVFPQELCQYCKITCLPTNPKEVITDENADFHAERLYCGHLFHLKCLMTYMKTSPFHGSKKCPDCGQCIYHDKWGLTDKLAEARWAHQQARERELAEVEDFFN